MQERFRDRAVVVTGSARGIGRAIALRFAREGASVVLNDILPVEGLERVAEECRQVGGKSAVVWGDLSSDPTTPARVVAAATEHFGRLDVVVNNAMWEERKPLMEATDDGWERTISVSLTAAMSISRAALGVMRASGGGAIIQVASVHSFAAGHGMIAYETAKAGLLGLTRSIAVDYGRYGIRSNAVCPGLVVTDRNAGLWHDQEKLEAVKLAYPVGRTGTEQDVAAAIAFLASDEASFINGACLPVDGGTLALLAEASVLDLYKRQRLPDR